MLKNNLSEIEIYNKLSKGEISKEEAMALLTENLNEYEEPEEKVDISYLESDMEMVLSSIATIAAENLHLPEDELQYDVSFKDLGVDSINGLEIIRDINRKFELNLDAVVLYDYATITKLSEFVFGEIKKNSKTYKNTINSESIEKGKVQLEGLVKQEKEIQNSDEDVENKIAEIVSENLHLPEGQLEYDLSFKDLGVDSINGLEIVRDVNREFELNLDAVVLYDYATVTKLSEFVSGEIKKNSKIYKNTIESSEEKPKELIEKGKVQLQSISGVKEEKEIQNSDENVEDKIAEIVSENLHLPEGQLEYDLSFKDLGVDSINGLEIVRDINRKFDLNLDAVVLYDYATVTKLSEFVLGEIKKTNKIYNDTKTKAIHTENKDTETQKLKLSKLSLQDTKKPLNSVKPTYKETVESKEKDSNQVKLKSLGAFKDKGENLSNNNALPPKTKLVSLDKPKKNTVEVKETHKKEEEYYEDDDIAIIGISGRFPGAENVDEFWNNLMTNTDSVTSIPSDRWDADKYFHKDSRTPNKSYSRVGGFLNNIDKFDPLFFNIPPVEAISMDPQQRIFLEETWRVLEDAGYSNTSLAGEKCGVFVGAAQGDYYKKLMVGKNETSGEAFTGIATSMFAARISYFLNLTGPSVTIDTACSSSLVALHLACQSIHNGDSDMAIVGGVRLNVTPDLHIATSKLEMLSFKDKCRAFDQSADGTIMSEGVGAIVIKPLKKAIEEKHSIYGIIKGSSINQDGKTNGITAPSAQSQYRLESAVYKKSKINPDDISYVEAHGTGTKLGDPIEVKALTNAFSEYTKRKQFCVIGSVKTNIGHTTNAAGVISLIKVLLSMKNDKIPATLHYETANEHIPFADTPFYVNTKAIDWKSKNGVPRLAAVSAFGFSGTNAHVVIQEYSKKNNIKRKSKLPFYLITISAKTIESYNKKIKDLLGWVENNSSSSTIEDIAYTLSIGRSHFNLRGAFIVRSISELKTKLEEIVLNGMTKDYYVNLENVKIAKTDINLKRSINEIIDKLHNGLKFSSEEYKENLLSLGNYYVKGQVTDYESIFIDDNLSLIHLPTYPFQGDSYWIEEKPDAIDVNFSDFVPRLHPLIDENVSTLTEQSFEKIFTGEEFFLKDHLVGKDKILPAVAYLEMARKAGNLANHKQKVVKITENYWSNFIKVDDISKKVNIVLLPTEADKNIVNYEVISKEDNERTILHGRGKIEYSDNKEFNSEVIDFAKIRERCEQKITGNECYHMFEKAGLNLGRSFQSINELFFNENEVLAKIKLPEHLKESFKEFNLHPTLMDGALEAVIGMLSIKAKSQGVRLPFYIGEVEIFGDLTENCYSYAKFAGTKKIGLQESECFDVFILDENGEVLIKFKDFSLWEIGKVKKKVEKSNYPMMYYSDEWTRSNIVLSEANHISSGNSIVVFDKDSNLRDLLKGKLSKENIQVILVKPGKDYEEYDDGITYKVNPNEKNDYIRLVESINKKGLLPVNIAYLWSKETYSQIESINEDNLNMSIYPVMYLSQALEKYKFNENIRLNYLFNGDNDSFSPLSAAFSGFAKSLRLENPKYIYKAIRISLESTLDEISKLVLLEFNKEADKDIEVAYENGERLVKNLCEYKLDISSSKSKPQITVGGVYLITGGLGKLGLIFANYLAKEYKAKICLSSRSSLDEDKKSQIEKLKDLGSEVIYVQGDISKFNDAENILNSIRNKFGKINGVIHCAGRNNDSYLWNKNKAGMDGVLKPKILGTTYLDLLTKNDDLDFFTLFSSTASVTGNLGQTDYSYANSFMDYYSQLREKLVNKGLRTGKTLSVNWPLWKDGGMKVGEETETLFKTMGISTLDKEKGIEAFIDGLKSSISQMIVFQGEREKIGKFLKVQLDNKKVDSSKEQNLEKVDFTDKVQKRIIQVVGEILRIKEKDIFLEKDMNEYGFNSLTFTEFANKINAIYNIELNPSIFYEHSTLKSLADYLNEEHYESIYKIYNENTVETTPIVQEVEEIHETFNLREGFNRPKVKEIVQEEEFTTTKVREPIAIIGMNGVMPQSEDLTSFWDNLEKSKDLITEVPLDRWDKDDLPDEISKWGGFMKEIDKFDPLFFGISPMEAELMDPQQRLFLQTVWKTIEDAGYKPSDLSGTKTGLFVGVSTTDYRDVLKDHEIQALTSTGNSHCILANRISFLLNLHGPSEPIDTACSSSLVAIHRGVESIYNGDCEMSIVGGVNVIASPTLHISFSKAGMLSPDGRCKTFDEKANGYVRGEGSGAILLKPLSKAIKDGDHIYALIKGTAINHGGHAASLTAPNPNAQAELIMETMEKAKLNPDTISYIEAHGTGTKLGDPIEINGLVKAFKELSKKKGITTNKKNYCGIGSIKTNIGHLETAAGIASILKVLLAIKHKKLPGTPNLEVQNPFIKLEESPFYIVKDTKEWEPLVNDLGEEIPLRAGVSSFGFGGVNAHVILEEYNEEQPYDQIEKTPQVIVLSAKNKEALARNAEKLYMYLKKTIKGETSNKLRLIDVSYTLQSGREEMDERLALVVSDFSELIEKLSEFKEGKTNIDNLYEGSAKANKDRTDFLVDGNSGLEIMNILISNKEFDKLASLWVSGIKIDWMQMYKTYNPRRVQLPTYEFEKRRVWIEEAKKEKPSKSLTKKKKQDQSIFDSFYVQSWKEAEAITINSKARDEKNGKVLILVPNNYYEVAFKLTKHHSNDEINIIRLGTTNKKHDINDWEIDVTDINALESCLNSITKLNTIYFLGGLISKTIDVNNLDQTQEQGVVTLFRLIKYLAEKDYANEKIKFNIWTNNVNVLDDNERNIPYSGSILGLVKTMAKEFLYWETSCLDIDMDELESKDSESLIEMLINEPINNKGDEVLIRKGKRYVRAIRPISVKENNNIPFKKEGVYVILGGAGGIGLEFSRYLSKTVQAKVALIGRSELTDDKKEKISKIEAEGGKVLYIRANATDVASMKEAIEKVKAEFGPINGVVHSAIVMKDMALYNMTEKDLKDALAPKVQGSAVLYEAVKEEKLDFMMFFSSIQTFVGNLGQANYAAACSFKDAFATYIRNLGKFQVKTINWGYWGTVGVASSKEYNERISATGLGSISPEEGMEAIERIISLPELKQTIVLKAEEFLLKQAGIEIGNNEPTKIRKKKIEKVSIAKEDVLKNIKDVIIQSIGEVLKVDSTEVDSDIPFSEYGVDSITGMELIKNINETFNVTLKTTVLFDYSNVDDLAEYLFAEYGTQIKDEFSDSLERDIDLSEETEIDNTSMKKAKKISTEDLSLIVEEKVSECVAEALKVHVSELDFDMQFSEYGVDSITGLTLIKIINDNFGTSLKNTVLFDYSNIHDFSRYLCDEHREKVKTLIKDYEEDSDSSLEALEQLADGELSVEEVLKMLD